ncbi:unnamed protein product [Nyctereutes procyonoides]|uniref:(raccoon dog) hypothetical protein n=1 Tax=Nyctereutes procyonoides TaxID=34880 RepID=A0A811ZLK2_NYCPR|nr:unnamed protein product [Nyctereutes procyonoides]
MAPVSRRPCGARSKACRWCRGRPEATHPTLERWSEVSPGWILARSPAPPPAPWGQHLCLISLVLSLHTAFENSHLEAGGPGPLPRSPSCAHPSLQCWSRAPPRHPHGGWLWSLWTPVPAPSAENNSPSLGLPLHRGRESTGHARVALCPPLVLGMTAKKAALPPPKRCFIPTQWFSNMAASSLTLLSWRGGDPAHDPWSGWPITALTDAACIEAS